MGFVKAYDALDYVLRLILAIIPFTGWIVGVAYRFSKWSESKNSVTLICAILNIPFGFVFWVIDLVSVILNKKIVWLAD